MAKPAGLIRRGSAYSYRRRVPEQLRGVFNKTELWISLGSTDYDEACVEARRQAVLVDQHFARTRAALALGEAPAPVALERVGEADLRQVVAGEVWKVERHAPEVAAHEEGDDRAALAAELHATIASYEANDGDAGPALFAEAAQVIRERKLKIIVPSILRGSDGLPLSEQPPATASPDFLRLLDLLRRAGIETRKRAIDRLEGRHGERAYDPLFEGISRQSSPPKLHIGTVTLSNGVED